MLKPASPVRRVTRPLALGTLGVLLVIACLASVAFGVRDITAADVLAALGGATDTASQAAAYQRIPRTLAAVVVGAALAVAGATMQAITRNPLADPGVFGVLSGSALAVVVLLTVAGSPSPALISAAAVLGAAGASAFVYAIGSAGRAGATPLTLALAGAATSAALTSLTTALILPRSQSLDSYRQWMVGGTGGTDWSELSLAAPVIAVGVLVALGHGGGLNALALGDDVAAGLGYAVTRTRLVGWGVAATLAGVATALCGPIAFIGLVVPHAVRLVSGPDQRWLLPLSAVGGAIFLVLADTLGRVVAPPAEIAVGVVTPLIGAPVFLWVVRTMKTRSL